MKLVYKLKSKIFFILLIFILLLVCTFCIYANEYPSSSIEAIVPWPAGGGLDVLMRTMAEYLEKELGVSIVVINRPGGGGAVGMVDLHNSKPDGYTIGITSSSIVQTAYCSTVPTPLENYEPIVYIGSNDAVFTIRADSPWETLEDFITAAKSQPGVLTNANDTPGGASHIAAIILEKAMGIELNKIPYAGFAPSVAALAGGHVDSTTVNLTDVLSMYKSGEFLILGVIGQNRHFLVPEIPTMIEQGYDAVSGMWQMILAPKGIPQDRLDILEKAFVSILDNPKLLETLTNAGYGMDPHGSSWTKEFLVKDDKKRYDIFYDFGMVIHPKP